MRALVLGGLRLTACQRHGLEHSLVSEVRLLVGLLALVVIPSR